MHPLLISAFTIFVCTALIFFVALLRRDNSVMDISYGLIFIVVALVTFSIGDPNIIGTLVTLLVIVWGIRLASRIFLKNRGKSEDKRYALWREEWMKRGSAYFVARSYFQIFFLQGFIIWLVSMPVVLANTTSLSWSALAVFGMAIWIIGFLFESVADYQLDRFLRNPENRGQIMTKGLFRYSRRPNYFGESLMWWGLAFMVVGDMSLWYVLVAPLTITYIMVFITGPITEKLWEGNDEYQAYKKRTSYFIPLPPKNL